MSFLSTFALREGLGAETLDLRVGAKERLDVERGRVFMGVGCEERDAEEGVRCLEVLFRFVADDEPRFEDVFVYLFGLTISIHLALLSLSI